MEINAAAIFLVHASPLDLAVGEDGAAAVMVIVKAWMDKGRSRENLGTPSLFFSFKLPAAQVVMEMEGMMAVTWCIWAAPRSGVWSSGDGDGEWCSGG